MNKRNQLKGKEVLWLCMNAEGTSWEALSLVFKQTFPGTTLSLNTVRGILYTLHPKKRTPCNISHRNALYVSLYKSIKESHPDYTPDEMERMFSQRCDTMENDYKETIILSKKQQERHKERQKLEEAVKWQRNELARLCILIERLQESNEKTQEALVGLQESNARMQETIEHYMREH